VTATVGDCCCTCCAVTPWTKSVDTCEDCLDAGPADSLCLAEGATPATTTTTTTTTQSTTTKSTTTTSRAATTTTQSQLPSEPTAYEQRPEPRGDFQNEEQLTETMASMSSSDLREFGYSLNDIILDCKFAGSNCDPASVACTVALAYNVT